MILPSQTNQTQLGGLGSGLGNTSNQASVDQMLMAAIAQGGVIGDKAAELQDPKTGAFATMTRGAVSALQGFVNAISIPQYALTGLLDPDRSVGEAIKDKVRPSDLYMDKPGDEASGWQKLGYYARGFALDTLLDPLTYVTFGASRGIVGLSRGTEIIAGKNLAAQLSKKAGMRTYLNEAGEELVDKYLIAKRKGFRESFIKDEYIKMVNKGVPENEINRRIKLLEDGVADALIKDTLDAPLKRDFAIKAVANLLEKKPELAKLYVDKGGIKFFGQSVLSGQRIREVMPLIPGMTVLDKATAPARSAIAGKFGDMFNPNYSGGSRLPDELIDMEQNWRNLYESGRAQLIRDGVKVKNTLKLSNEEWEFVTAAIEHGLKPRDPNAADVWHLLHNAEPPNGTIPENVWKGLIEVNKLQKKTLKSFRDAGMRIPNQKGYFPHMLVDQEVGDIPFIPMVGRQTTDRQRFARISALVNEDGVRMPVRMMSKPDKDGNVMIQRIVDGDKVEEQIRFVDISRELPRVEDVFTKQSESLKTAIKQISDKITADNLNLKKGVAAKLVDDVSKLFDDIPELTKQDREILTEAVTNLVSDADVDKIVKGRLKRFYSKGLKLSNGQSISKADVDKLALDIVMAKGEATAIASQVNKLLAAGVKLPHQTTATAATKRAVDKEVATFARELKREAAEIKKKVLERKVDDDAVVNLLKQVVARTSKNPKGLNQTIDRLIKNKQVAQDLKDELSDISRAFQREKEELLEASGKYMDESGQAFERQRIRIEEAKRLGVDFEDNALAVTLASSHDALRISTTRHFVQDVKAKFGMPESMAPDGYVHIEKLGLEHEGQDVAKWLTNTKGERLMFHPDVAKRLTEFTTDVAGEETTSTFFRGYDTLQNYFKAAVTAIFPAFHGRNALSNVFLMYNKIGTAALDPVNHVAASHMLGLEKATHSLRKRMAKASLEEMPDVAKEYAQHMSKVVFTDRTGYNWTWGEMRKEIIDNAVAFQPRTVGMADQIRFGNDQVADAVKRMFPETTKDKVIHAIKPVNPFDVDNALFRGGFAVGQTIEDYSRTLTFLAQLRGTGDPIQAARVTKQALFDYRNLTKFEKEVMRRIIPFYTFSRKNIELQLKTLVTEPGKLAQQIRAVESVGDAFGGGPLTEEEYNRLPEWAKAGYNVVTQRTPSHVTLLNTLGTPLEEVFNRANAQANIGIVSPLVKLPFEMASGYSTFHGRPISEVTNADAYQFAPRAVQDFIGYEEIEYTDSQGNKGTYHTSFYPERMFMINNIQPVGRLMSEINRLEKAPDGASQIRALFFGISTREFDLDLEEQRRARETKQQLEALLDQAGLGYSFSRFVFTGDE